MQLLTALLLFCKQQQAQKRRNSHNFYYLNYIGTCLEMQGPPIALIQADLNFKLESEQDWKPSWLILDRLHNVVRLVRFQWRLIWSPIDRTRGMSLRQSRRLKRSREEQYLALVLLLYSQRTWFSLAETHLAKMHSILSQARFWGFCLPPFRQHDFICCCLLTILGRCDLNNGIQVVLI